MNLTILSSVTSSYAQVTTDTPTSVPPTETPIPTPEENMIEDPTGDESSDPLGPELPPPEPNEQTMIGPQLPQQQIPQQPLQQQKGKQGDVESAFSDGGLENILDNKPDGGSGGVIKIFVTVIALTFTGIIGWLTMRSNEEIVAGEKSEEHM